MRAARAAASQKAVRLILRPSSRACRAVSKLYVTVRWCIVRSVARSGGVPLSFTELDRMLAEAKP